MRLIIILFNGSFFISKPPAAPFMEFMIPLLVNIYNTFAVHVIGELIYLAISFKLTPLFSWEFTRL